MICKKCGAEINDKAVVCVHCGTRTCLRDIPGFSSFENSGALRSERSFETDLEPGEVDDRVCSLSQYGLLFEVVGRNVIPNGFEYKLTTNMGIRSIGEQMYVRCERRKTGTHVYVLSQGIHWVQLITFGKNAENVRALQRVLSN